MMFTTNLTERNRSAFFCIVSENVAVGKSASQSGSRYEYSRADRAVDGNRNRNMTSGSCAHPGRPDIRMFVLSQN